MLGKSAFIVRSLFATAFIASLVACTFEERAEDEDRGNSSSHVRGARGGTDESGDDEDAGSPVTDLDGGAPDGSWSVDGGPYHHDVDAGRYNPDGGPHHDVDGGAYHHDIDAGPYDRDGGAADVDGGF